MMAGAAAFNRRLELFADRTLSPAAQSAKLAALARRELAALIASGRASPSYRRFVDGTEGKPEEAVRPAPSGAIVYRFVVLGPVVMFALAFLVERSPDRTGKFRAGFALGIDGKFVPAAQFNPAALTANVEEISIFNVEPYSRKLTVQLIGGRSLHFSVPPGLFADAAAAIKSRYGAIVECKTRYNLSFPGQYVLKGGKKAGSRVESPGLIITPRR